MIDCVCVLCVCVCGVVLCVCVCGVVCVSVCLMSRNLIICAETSQNI